MTILQRAIGLPSATALVVGTIIGSSIFVQASEITNLVPDPFAVVLAWAVAGALTLIGALVCAELASAYPRTGGVYVDERGSLREELLEGDPLEHGSARPVAPLVPFYRR